MSESCQQIIDEIMPLLERLANCGCQEPGGGKTLKDILKLRPKVKLADLNVIEQKILAEGGVESVRELINKTEPELLRLRRMNHVALANIEHKLLGEPETPSIADILHRLQGAA